MFARIFQIARAGCKLGSELIPWPFLSINAGKPTAIKIHVKTGAGVDITWADGHTSHFDFPLLRENCPCATCNDERGKKEIAIETHASQFAAVAFVQAESPRAIGHAGRQLCNPD